MGMRKFIDKIKPFGTAALAYLGITVAVNAAALPLQAGIEALTDLPKKEQRVTLKEKNMLLLPGTHGRVFCGDFELQDGREIRACDYASVLEGKLAANRYIPSMEEGSTYDAVVKGSEYMGYNIVDLVE